MTVSERELTGAILETNSADLLSGDLGGWRPGEVFHTSPGMAMR